MTKQNFADTCDEAMSEDGKVAAVAALTAIIADIQADRVAKYAVVAFHCPSIGPRGENHAGDLSFGAVGGNRTFAAVAAVMGSRMKCSCGQPCVTEFSAATIEGIGRAYANGDPPPVDGIEFIAAENETIN